MSDRSDPRPSERGSALLLFPAGILIVFVLSAMSVDLSAAFLAQRELHDATAAAAADATAALARDAYYAHGTVTVDAAAAEEVARSRMALAVDRRRHTALEVHVRIGPPEVPGCPGPVVVSASSTVDHVFGAALPGSSGGIRVMATSAARPEQAAGGCVPDLLAE